MPTFAKKSFCFITFFSTWYLWRQMKNKIKYVLDTRIGSKVRSNWEWKRQKPALSLYSNSAPRLYLWLQVQKIMIIPLPVFAWPLTICATVFLIPKLNNEQQGRRGKKNSLFLDGSAGLSFSAHSISRALLWAGKSFTKNVQCVLTAAMQGKYSVLFSPFSKMRNREAFGNLKESAKVTGKFWMT